MYKLTLTLSERQAIDWVGYRYRHGDELYRLLWVECVSIPDTADWDDPGEILFLVPEAVAWRIQEMGEDCHFAWDCFGLGLTEKLNAFCLAIV